MKQALIALFVAAFGFGLVADAEAKRIGGGRSSGMQRNITPQKPVAPAQGATAAPTAPVPQPSGMSRWLGPVAGLAAGIGLVALLSHLGLGEGFATIVMMLLITLAVFVVIRLLFGRRTPQQSQPLQYAGGGATPSAAGNTRSGALRRPALRRRHGCGPCRERQHPGRLRCRRLPAPGQAQLPAPAGRQ
ncbi:MAG: hypothetical protein M5R42_14995 [Rhodocyclaceae bacterium]|nr:hypothetical protein [Rhodocyclaceae bacterium]